MEHKLLATLLCLILILSAKSSLVDASQDDDQHSNDDQDSDDINSYDENEGGQNQFQLKPIFSEVEFGKQVLKNICRMRCENSNFQGGKICNLCRRVGFA